MVLRKRTRGRQKALDIPPTTYNHMVVDSLSLTLAALADPTRRKLLRRLTAGSSAVGKLARPYGITQQAISKHLACLKRAKLIEKRRDGRVQLCSLNAKPIKEVADWAAEYRRFWEESFEKLDALLDEMKTKETRHDRQDQFPD